MKYLAEDGKVFDNESSCLEYENSKKNREQERVRRVREVKEEVAKSTKHLIELIDKLYEDFPELAETRNSFLGEPVVIRRGFPF